MPVDAYRDSLGNWRTRIVAPAGRIRLTANAVVNDTVLLDAIDTDAQQIPVEQLPVDTLIHLLGSRHCDTDRLSHAAWELFEDAPTGRDRAQAICDYVHNHVAFGYEYAQAPQTALETFTKGTVCMSRLQR